MLYTISDGNDFAEGPYDLVFNEGDSIPIQRCGEVAIFDDNVLEGDHVFFLFFKTDDIQPSGVVSLINPTETLLVIIRDNEGMWTCISE